MLSLLRELVPKAVRVGVLVNPINAVSTEATLPAVREAAHALGLQARSAKSMRPLPRLSESAPMLC